MKTKLMMKLATTVAGLMAVSLLPAYGTLTMTISDGINPTVTVTDNEIGPEVDLSSTVGAILWSGSIGAWTLDVNTGESKPFLGSATDPMMSLNANASSTAAGGTLTITLSDTGFGPVTPDTSTFSVNTTANNIGGTASAFGTVNGVSSAASSLSTFGAVTVYGTASGLATAPWSMGESLTLVNTGAQVDNVTATLAVPEPTTMVAGAMLLLPFGASTLRILRRKSTV
jgi:hypothetical protein